MLHRLGLTQSKVRHIPLQLHCRRIILPEINNGTNVNIAADPPKLFSHTLKKLKLKT